MALIPCPECGKQVSSAAVSCPDCGYPIAEQKNEGYVSIKICNGLAGKVKVCKVDDSSVLWIGKAGQVAKFKIDEDTLVGFTWGFGSHGLIHQILVQANHKYELAWQQGFLSKDIVVNEIDFIS